MNKRLGINVAYYVIHWYFNLPIAGVGSGVFGLFFLVTVGCYINIWRKAQTEVFFKRNGGILLQQLYSGEANIEKSKLSKSNELEKATDKFNKNRVLGHGGQGTVCKGMLVMKKLLP